MPPQLPFGTAEIIYIFHVPSGVNLKKVLDELKYFAINNFLKYISAGILLNYIFMSKVEIFIDAVVKYNK